MNIVMIRVYSKNTKQLMIYIFVIQNTNLRFKTQIQIQMNIPGDLQTSIRFKKTNIKS